ncbi:hypothetical protein [Microbispora sp. NPDC046933]|uniref:hypothetical protein n=1 Tax=Microbispora sp. NPDC046933 TaxID=3155618 RepID=UPI0033E3A602
MTAAPHPAHKVGSGAASRFPDPAVVAGRAPGTALKTAERVPPVPAAGVVGTGRA